MRFKEVCCLALGVNYLPQGRGLGFRSVLQVGRHVGEEVEAGAGLDGIDGGNAGGVLHTGVGFIRVNVCAAGSGGHLPIAVERTKHKALIEVTGNWHVQTAAGLGLNGSFVKNTCHNVQCIPSGRGILCHILLQTAPDSVIETVLPLGRLV